MLFLLLSTVLTSAFALAQPCDQSRLAQIEKLCGMKERSFQDLDGMDAIMEKERMMCACTDMLTAEERDCYVRPGDSLTLQQKYDEHCSDLDDEQTMEERNADDEQTMEEQVAFISYIAQSIGGLLSSCGDPSRASCRDVDHETGCPAHFVTHKEEYNDNCGSWWSSAACDRCCESGKNIVDVGETSGKGGTCECPDGYKYPVGTAANCVDGTVTKTSASSSGTGTSDQKVTCRPFVKKITSSKKMIVTGCGIDDSSCGFVYNLDRTIGAAAETELENSVERNSEDEDDEEEETTTIKTTKAADDDDDKDKNGWDFEASAMVGATFSAGAQTRVHAQLKGSLSYDFDLDFNLYEMELNEMALNEMKLRLELNKLGFEMDAKILLGLEAGVELSGTKKLNLGPEFDIGPQTINIPVSAGVSMPIIVSMAVRPIANLAISGNVAASGMFTIENVYHVSYSDMFIEFDLLNFKTTDNLDTVTTTRAYSDMYTLLLEGELGFEVNAYIGVEVDLMLYEAVGVTLTPAVSTKLAAGGSAEYLKRWSTTTVVPDGQVSHSCYATACIGSFVDAGLNWIGAELVEDVESVKEKMGVNRRQLAPLSFGKQLQQSCQTTMHCTMGIFANLLSGVCDLDPSSLLDINLAAPSFSLKPPAMTIPIGEVCHTIGQEDGDFYSRTGDTGEVACASGSANTCAGCRTESNCGGDCQWKYGACIPADQDYTMNPGAVCGEDFQAITTGWQDCKTAAEALGYEGDTVAHVGSTIQRSDRPQGCFVQGDGQVRVYYNTIDHGKKFVGGDAIICVAGVAVEQATGELALNALNYSSWDGQRNILLTGFAMIGVVSTIVYLWQHIVSEKYESIPEPSFEEI